MNSNAAESFDWITGMAFGHRFSELRGNIEDLVTLEKEGAIYSHFWDDEVGSFRYFRVRLLPREIFEYVEAALARQEFMAAYPAGASFDDALAAITRPEIRERVRSYGNFGKMPLKDGTVVDIRGCAASFYTPELEQLVCGQRRDRYEVLPEISAANREALIIGAIDNFPVIRRLVAERKHGRPAFAIETEYDVQDLLFCILRSVFSDARTEDWTPMHAGSSKRIDMVIPSLRVVIETKLVRDGRHARAIADELKIDIESYHSHPACGTLIAFVHDPHQYIVDPEQLMRDLSGHRAKGKASFNVEVLVR